MLDNLIHQEQLPPMVAVTIEAGGQDAQGSERGFEYDTVSGTYAEFVERKVLPLVEHMKGIRVTSDPDGRAAMGISSSGAAAFTMAWFHPELYHRILAYSMRSNGSGRAISLPIGMMMTISRLFDDSRRPSRSRLPLPGVRAT